MRVKELGLCSTLHAYSCILAYRRGKSKGGFRESRVCEIDCIWKMEIDCMQVVIIIEMTKYRVFHKKYCKIIYVNAKNN